MNGAAFLKTLPIMLYGMLGIFVVMLAIYALILLFAKMTSGKSSEES
ncbi:MAG TPA: oxaloacetate decarboxylase [Clostridia bacterium]|nr:oxaloacetate decarboxylase [Clostridia bacterium]